MVDPAQLTDPEIAPAGYDGDTDPGYAELVLRNAASVPRTAARHYTGFGTTRTPVAPAADEQMKPTPGVYELLNG